LHFRLDALPFRQWVYRETGGLSIDRNNHTTGTLGRQGIALARWNSHAPLSIHVDVLYAPKHDFLPTSRHYDPNKGLKNHFAPLFTTIRPNNAIVNASARKIP
jgi:hypothetical protein